MYRYLQLLLLINVGKMEFEVPKVLRPVLVI